MENQKGKINPRLNDECVRCVTKFYLQHEIRGRPLIYVRLLGQRFYRCFWEGGYYVMWISTMFRLKHDKHSFHRPVQIMQNEVKLLLEKGWLQALELHGVYDISDSMEALKLWLNGLEVNGSLALILSGHFYFFYTILKDEIIAKKWKLGYVKMKFDALSGQIIMMDHYLNFYPYAFQMCQTLSVAELRLSFTNTRFELLQKTITDAKTRTVFMEMKCGSTFFDLEKYITQPNDNQSIEEFILDLRGYQGSCNTFIRYAIESLKAATLLTLIRTERTQRDKKKQRIALEYNYSELYPNIKFIFITVVAKDLTDPRDPLDLPLRQRERYLIRQCLSFPIQFQFVHMTSNSIQLTMNLD
ncbi:unnamed protein product [Bursaphelenchus xylophilus]|uniref:(pine wood nematode) hypothetical protein n=1 Tax=Bursaphelenchus xylophilus TaxID=6326 RepID=A0A1I7S4Y8_BURXY|nr:unnamed protein product [Bursaphelenchus xylophilus]CAG9117511.1 unnamed protein product [Bursaphelenchus xylophilus]